MLKVLLSCFLDKLLWMKIEFLSFILLLSFLLNLSQYHKSNTDDEILDKIV